MGKKVVVIGSGFSSLAAATVLADQGFSVSVLEKNDQAGGRARQFHQEGFTFDMGPSWYWMPDVFDSYFERFGKKVSDYYQLKRLDPSYRIYFGKEDVWDIPASMEGIEALFEKVEKGAATQLRKFLKEAAYKYEVGINDLVYKPGKSWLEFADWRVMSGVFRLQLFNSLSAHVKKYFKHPNLIQLMEFPVLFLGAKPQDTPALYSLMNYADMQLGTWYPEGGMHEIVKGMVQLAEEKGVEFEFDAEVSKIHVEKGKVVAVDTSKGERKADVFVAGSDYHHTEKLLEKQYRNYDDRYWEKRDMAPSSLIFYLGVNKKLKGLSHHTLFFDTSFEQHAKEIYDEPQWPSDPLFYVSCTSLSDPKAAPEGEENLFILIPLAPGISDDESIREKYYHLVIERIEKLTGQSIAPHVTVKRSYALNDFVKDYHAFKGNAYGLANTLRQTAVLKPSLRNKKVSNLFFTGQLTTPGPGVPPSLISGQVVANEVIKTLN